MSFGRVKNSTLVKKRKKKEKKKLNIGDFKVFGCKFFILNSKDNLGNFNSESDIRIFLSYSTTSKAYRVFNKRNLVVEKPMHVLLKNKSQKMMMMLVWRKT